MKTFAGEYGSRAAAWSDIQEHLDFLYNLALKSAVILELGVRGGISTGAFLAGVEKSGGHLWSIDLEEPAVPAWWRQSKLWTLTIGNDLDARVAEKQPKSIDLLFIDTNHLFEHTLAELRLYAPRVKPGGAICCHDTELVEAESGLFPVARALYVYCSETQLRWVNRPGSYGLGVIRLPI